MARSVLEPQGRWDEFVTAYRDLVTRFNPAEDGGARDRVRLLRDHGRPLGQPVLERALDGRVERVEPVQRQRLG